MSATILSFPGRARHEAPASKASAECPVCRREQEADTVEGLLRHMRLCGERELERSRWLETRAARNLELGVDTHGRSLQKPETARTQLRQRRAYSERIAAFIEACRTAGDPGSFVSDELAEWAGPLSVYRKHRRGRTRDRR